ncbi:MAG: sulfotransferase domain-containing protein, partial [Pseudomonadota bacterium]
DNFRKPREIWPDGEAFMDDVLSARVLNNWTASRLPLRRAAFVRRWVIKFVRANPLLAWMVEQFDMPKPILVVRHPCAVYSSWTYRNWPVADYPPPKQCRYFSAFPEHLGIRDEIHSKEEYFAAAWCMEHSAVFRQLPADRYHLCFYEDLLANPEAELSRLCSVSELELPASIADVLKRPSGKASDTLDSDSNRQLSLWQQKLPEQTAERIIGVLRRFDLELYDTNPLPLSSNARRSPSADPDG